MDTLVIMIGLFLNLCLTLWWVSKVLSRYGDSTWVKELVGWVAFVQFFGLHLLVVYLAITMIR